MTARGSALIVLVLILGILLGVAGFFAYQNYFHKIAPSTQQSESQTTQTPKPSPSPADETVNWKVYGGSSYGFSFKYPNNWAIEKNSTVLLDENGQKVAELSPGKLTLNQEVECKEVFRRTLEGGPPIKAKETNLSFEEPQRLSKISQETIDLNNQKWELLVVKASYEGSARDPSGIWYPHMYCTKSKDSLLMINFYEIVLPAQKKLLFDQILSTFKFTN